MPRGGGSRVSTLPQKSYGVQLSRTSSCSDEFSVTQLIVKTTIGNEFYENKITVPNDIRVHQSKPSLAEQMVNRQPTQLMEPARNICAEVG